MMETGHHRAPPRVPTLDGELRVDTAESPLAFKKAALIPLPLDKTFPPLATVTSSVE